MQITRKLVLVLTVVLILIIPTAALAQGPDEGDQVVIGESYRLGSGDRLAGNLIVLAGTVDLEEGSTIEGDLLQFGGSVALAGEILGSAEIYGGDLQMDDSAVIHGDFSRLGGEIQRSPQAQVLGSETGLDNLSRTLRLPFILGNTDFLGDGLNLGSLDSMDFFNGQDGLIPRFSMGRSFDFGEFGPGFLPLMEFSPLEKFFSALIQAVLYAVLAALAVLFLPRPADRVKRAVRVQPFLAGGLGLITLILAVPILALLGFTLVLLPLSFFALLVLLALVLFGWIAIGLEVGARVSSMFHRDWHPALAAGVGVLTLSLAKTALGQIPCVGVVATIVIASVGLGGLWLTRLGTREYQSESDLPSEIQ